MCKVVVDVWLGFSSFILIIALGIAHERGF